MLIGDILVHDQKNSFTIGLISTDRITLFDNITSPHI